MLLSLITRDLKIRTSIKTIIVLLFVLAVANCSVATPTPDEQLVDRSFLTDQPCSAPCWYELRVDESSESDILETVKEIPFIDVGSQLDEVTTWGGDKAAHRIHFDCLYGSQRYPGCVSFLTSKELLKRIQIYVSYTLTIEMMIDKLDTPDSYIAFTEPGETIACSMTFFWTNKQIIASNYQKEACPQPIDKIPFDTPIHTLYYSAKDDRYLELCPGCGVFPGIK